jgi:CDP-diacylglycerol---serine O-phosphatidyltransferase
MAFHCELQSLPEFCAFLEVEFMDLKKTVFILPNLFTAASLFCGVWAILRCVGSDVTVDDVYRSSLLLFYAFIFDLFDGRVARMTRTQSAFGVEFDSLADLISFGVAPAIIAYRWALDGVGFVGGVVAVLYVLGGAIRLARFNVLAHAPKTASDKPGKYMLGLPIPMAAAFIVAFVVAARAMEDGQWPWLTASGLSINGIGYPMLMVFMVLLAFLMVSTVKFRSFKDLAINAFTISCVISVIAVSGVLWIFYSPAYILMGLLMMYVGFGFIEGLVQIAGRPSAGRKKSASRQD